MPLLNFSMLDQSSIVMHIVQRNRFIMLTIFKIWEEKDWSEELYISSSKVYLSTVLVRIIKMPYKQPQVSRKDEKTTTLHCVCPCSPSAWRERLVGFFLLRDTWLFYFREVVSWATCESSFLYYCSIISLSFLYHMFTSQFSELCRPA